MTANGKICGLQDDGDIFVFNYRKDILGDPAIQEALLMPCRPCLSSKNTLFRPLLIKPAIKKSSSQFTHYMT